MLIWVVKWEPLGPGRAYTFSLEGSIVVDLYILIWLSLFNNGFILAITMFMQQCETRIPLCCSLLMRRSSGFISTWQDRCGTIRNVQQLDLVSLLCSNGFWRTLSKQVVMRYNATSLTGPAWISAFCWSTHRKEESAGKKW